MKLIFQAILFIIFVTAASNAQNRSASAIKITDREAVIAKVQASDTLDYTSQDGVIYVTDQDGYLNGTNEWNDKGKYQRFDISGNNSITHVYMAFGGLEVRPAGSPDTISLVVRDVNANGSPGTLLSSRSIITSEFDTTSWNVYELNAPLAYDDTFFVGIEWTGNWNDGSADKFGLVSDEIGQGEGSKRAWELRDDNSFHSIHDAWNEGQMDIDLWIGVIFDQSTSVIPQPEPIPASYALAQNYPNPFNPGTKINYYIPYESNVKLTVYSSLGETIHELVNAVHQPGIYTADFNTAVLASGLYFYKIEASALDGSEQFLQIKKMMLLK